MTELITLMTTIVGGVVNRVIDHWWFAPRHKSKTNKQAPVVVSAPPIVLSQGNQIINFRGRSGAKGEQPIFVQGVANFLNQPAPSWEQMIFVQADVSISNQRIIVGKDTYDTSAALGAQIHGNPLKRSGCALLALLLAVGVAYGVAVLAFASFIGGLESVICATVAFTFTLGILSGQIKRRYRVLLNTRTARGKEWVQLLSSTDRTFAENVAKAINTAVER